MGHGVWIFEEHDHTGTRKITLELISEGRKLARRLKQPLCLVVIGAGVSSHASSLSRYGVEMLFLVDHDALADYALEPYSNVLAALVAAHAPSIVLFGATPAGAELAPRVAAKRKIPCITDVKKIKSGKDGFKITKSVYGDQAYAQVRAEAAGPLIITIAPGETDAASPGKETAMEIVATDADPGGLSSRTRSGRFIKGDPRTIKITDADRIVAGGRGAGAAGFETLRGFADLLGAAMAGSRAAVDDGHIPVERQIGISGRTVVPKLLVTGGISGAREFTVGMEDTDLVIAINTDPKARIFDFANLCIKGDVNRVIPAVMEKLKAS